MKGVAYKLKHIRWKFDEKQSVTEDFKSKQQKSFISLNIATTFILQIFSSIHPAPILLQPCYLFLLF